MTKGGLGILVVIALVGGCGRQEEKEAAKAQASGTISAATPKLSADSVLRDWADSIIEQAGTQGVKIDSSNQEALAVLLRVYLVRSDLHKGFGEPDLFNLTVLLQWAAGAAVTVDGAKEILSPYAASYASLVKKLEGQKQISISLK